MEYNTSLLRKIFLVSIIVLFIFATRINSFSQMNTEKFRDFKSDGLYHTINLAVDYNKGNEDYVKYSADYRLDLYHEQFLTYLVGSLEYKEGNSSVLTNNGLVHLRFIFNQKGRIEPEVFTQLDYNDFIFLEQRILGGGGLRLSLFNKRADSSNQLVAELGMGLMYEYEEYINNAESTKRYIRSTNFLNLRYSYLNNIVLSSVTYYQPYINDFRDFRILSENRVSFIITKFLAFFVSTNYRYDSYPPKGLKNFDFELNNGISINF